MPGADPAWARALATSTADRPGLTLLDAAEQARPFLALTDQRLELRWPAGGMHPLYVDFDDPVVGRRIHAGRRDPLARALGLHRKPNQTVVDATCGLGRDSALLLGRGCTIHACERSEVLFALLRDGVRRARLLDKPGEWWGPYAGDAASRLAADEFPDADAIYLDPMFDAPRRRALPGRDMQYLQAAVGADMDAGDLLATARAAAAEKVVVKRHPRQAPLSSPDYSVNARQVCFDVYLHSNA